MARTPEEIQADIDILKQTRMSLATGSVSKSMTIGTDSMQRKYEYYEINVTMLNNLLRELEQELNEVTDSAVVCLEQFNDGCRTHAVRLQGRF